AWQVDVVAGGRAVAARDGQVPPERVPQTGRLAEGIRAMTAARSLSEVLDTLVNGAAQEAARAGVLLVRGDRFHGWRSLGFDPAFGRATPPVAPAEAAV